MDYDNTSYAEAKQLIKVAEPPASAAPAAGASWLSDLPGKFQESYGAHPSYWNMGIGALGGAGLGALSSIWQPKRRKNTLGRAITGGLLGGLAGGAYGLVRGANKGYQANLDEQAATEARDKTRTEAEDARSKLDVYGTGGENTALERLWKGISRLGEGAAPLGEAVLSQSGVESAGEDISRVTAGKPPQYNLAPEAASVAAILAAKRFRNRATKFGPFGGHGPLTSQVMTEIGPDRSSNLEKAIDAETQLRTQARGSNPFKKDFWKALGREQLDRLKRGSRRTRVMGGLSTMKIPAAGIQTRYGTVKPDTVNPGQWRPQIAQAKTSLKAIRGGRVRRGGKTALLAILANLGTRGLIESGLVSGRGDVRTRARYLDAQDEVRRTEADLRLQQNRSKELP